ncbi:hypothetical protein BGX29_002572 [Mortierella sp. GBA35]|nr:hypothetical protein BGX29_002572 [Mortierella sp. GBA35]
MAERRISVQLPALSTVLRYGSRALVVFCSLATIVDHVGMLLRFLIKNKDLTSEALMAKFVPRAIFGSLSIAVDVQRIGACFTSTTVLVQLAFYLWAVECFFKSIVFFWTTAMVLLNKDYAKTLAAKAAKAKAAGFHGLWSKFLLFSILLVGFGLRMVLNELRKKDREAQLRREQVLELEKDMPPHPVTSAAAFNAGLRSERVDAQKQLLRVRTWPRVVIGFLMIIYTIQNPIYYMNVLSSESIALTWHQKLHLVVSWVTGCVGLWALYTKSRTGSQWIFRALVVIILFENWFSFQSVPNDQPPSIQLAESNNTVTSLGNSTVTIGNSTATTSGNNVELDEHGKALADFIGQVCLVLLDGAFLWSMWQVVEDLRKRDERIAQAAAAAATQAITFDHKESGTQYLDVAVAQEAIVDVVFDASDKK